ncbi:MAG: hypothetical protein C0594_01605 [Marinilabiliales bacterium]|nr:MAG: hypothetical protein C0594_01605 [Marinilabiliales bacterium]
MNQTFDEKGKVRKFVTKYSKTDTSLVENYMYDDKDSLVYRITYDGDWKFPLESIHYKKGKENYKTINLYENGKLLTRTQYNRGKMTGRKEFRYENDILSEFISYNRKNEISERISLNIQMYN